MRQDAPDKFTDVTAATKLPKNVTNGAYTGAWALDIEADGDLDVVLGTKDGTPKVLRNNGAAPFKEIGRLGGVSAVKARGVADPDNDGVLDLLAVEATGTIATVSYREDNGWSVTPLVQIPGGKDALDGEGRLP